VTVINGVALGYDNAAERHAIENPGHRVNVLLDTDDILKVECTRCEHWDHVGNKV
jgi:predicted Rossmann fold nucleotide-binding protein DprA/Smf involved in DNA uptake